MATTLLDAGAVARVVERFQNWYIVPRRLIAEFASNDVLHIAVDAFGLPVSSWQHSNGPRSVRQLARSQ